VCFQRYKQRETTQTPESQPVDKPCPSPRGIDRTTAFVSGKGRLFFHPFDWTKERALSHHHAGHLTAQATLKALQSLPTNQERRMKGRRCAPLHKDYGHHRFLLSHLSEIIASKRGRKPNNEHTQFMTYRYKEKGPPFISKSQQIHRDGLLAYFP